LHPGRSQYASEVNLERRNGLLEIKGIQHGRVDLAKDPCFFAGHEDISPAAVNKRRVSGFLHGIVN
jgi:hypothetical protein